MTSACRDQLRPDCGRATACEVKLRRFPYPYRAALAICSDLDKTPDRRVYWEIMRFLNTTETTSMGPGVGLEVGNTIYFDMPPDQFAYWNTDDHGRAMVRALIHSGHIDCLHSYGDLATHRRHAGKALDELTRHDCRLKVWVDHSKAPTNFGPDIMCGAGDVTDSPAYHADLTCQYGIEYVWRGRTTSVIGQDVDPHLAGIFTSRHPLASAKTVAKQAAKLLLARAGYKKYATHGANVVLQDASLRDGRHVKEFLRCNPYWGGVGEGATSDGLAQVLTDPFLDRLVECGGACILYTHMGKITNPRQPFGPRTCAALRRLADWYQDGRILVTTTSRLLGLLYTRATLQWSARDLDGNMCIDIGEAASAEACEVSTDTVQGLCFCVERPDLPQACVALGGTLDVDIIHDARRTLVAVPFRRMDYPSI